VTDVPLPFPPHADAPPAPPPAAPSEQPAPPGPPEQPAPPGPPEQPEQQEPAPTSGTGEGRRPRGTATRSSTPRRPPDAGRVLAAPPALVPFLDAGLLAPVDVHVAVTLGRVRGDERPDTLLAAALAVRAPRLKHVCIDLRTVRDTIVANVDEDDPTDLDIDALPWPDVEGWLRQLAVSPLVTVRDPATRDEPAEQGRDIAPLTLAAGRLYLDRYWHYERRVAAALHTRALRTVGEVDVPTLRRGLDVAFTGVAPDRQRVAAAAAVLRHLAVVAGGPGTGKTTTVAAILRLLDEQAAACGRRPPAVALAAPTGKAAQRLTASLREAAAGAGAGPVDPGTGAGPAGGAAPSSDRLREATATTLHRLLGPRGRSNRFVHHRDHPLPHDVVVVDETSMVDLAMLAKLLDAVRDDARVVLLGDPHQLASVEAGSALGDVLGDPERRPIRSASALADLRAAAGAAHLADTTEHASAGVHDATVVLDRVHRFRAGSGLDRLAAAIRIGDADHAIDVLASADDLTWVPLPEATGRDAAGGAADGTGGGGLRAGRRIALDAPALEEVRELIVAAGLAVHDAAADGDHARALAAMDRVRILCAHRRGEQGVAGWIERIEAWLAATGQVDPSSAWYLGRPVLVTANDRRHQLWNGDLGVVVRGEGGRGVAVAFPRPDGDGTRTLAPARLGEVETVHAMTVHKAQGSQVEHAVVVLPDPASRICTRELLYTAVTRAKRRATVICSEAALRATIAARISRTSGLADALGIVAPR
jgi:exodeoxyribonuclease V alpha subunit